MSTVSIPKHVFPKPDSDYTVRDQERMRLARNYFDWQSRLVEPHAGRRVLEIGCGLGNFTRYLMDRECVIGLDVEPACIDGWRAAFADQPHMSAHMLDVCDESFLQLREQRPDTVICLNVLEHIEDDHRALAHMSAVLPKGGRALLIVPAFESLYGPIDHNLGHYRRYSRASFGETAKRAGFRANLRYMNTVGMIGWWVNAKLKPRAEQSEGQIAFFDSVIVPVMSRLEGWVPPPFGQSLFAVLSKE